MKILSSKSRSTNYERFTNSFCQKHCNEKEREKIKNIYNSNRFRITLKRYKLVKNNH